MIEALKAMAAGLAAALATVAAVPVAAAPPLHGKTAAPLTADASTLLTWVKASADHRGLPFMVIDKRQARLWVLDAQARVIGSTPVLLGLAVGDHTVAGIGERPLEQVLPEERTTPAGRFGIEPGRNLDGEDILWLDYDAGVSMHRVRTGNKTERRLQRLATPTGADNRISFGCINVPAAFYDRYIQPLFAQLPRDRAAIYLLPETRPLRSAFAFAPRR